MKRVVAHSEEEQSAQATVSAEDVTLPEVDNAVPAEDVLPPEGGNLPSLSVAELFSPAVAAELFSHWCRTGVRPEMPEPIIAIPLTFVRAYRANELAEPVFLFADHPQIGPFVRFAASTQADVAVAFPHPDAAFNSDVHPMLFPTISAAAFENAADLAAVEPVPLRRRIDQLWEKSA